MPGTKEKIRVLIVDDIAETRDNLRKLLSFDADLEVVGTGASGEEGIALAKQLRPDIVLMDINMPGIDGIKATEVIVREVPTAQIVILSVQGEADYLRRAMLAGARDFLTKPPTGDELMTTIRRVYEMGRSRAAAFVPVSAPESGKPAAGPSRDGGRNGKIVAVYAPKGGVGCTTLAVNLAVALQGLVGASKKVAIFDANLQFGDVGVLLNLQASRSVADLATHLDELDEDLLSSVVAPHGSGIKVMLAPPHPETADVFLASGEDQGGSPVKKILLAMRREYDIVVVDTWSWIDNTILTVLDVAAFTVLLTTPTIPAIKNARLFLEVASKLDYSYENVLLTVNCVDRRMGIRVEDIEQAMMPVAGQIPLDERAALSAANRGVPFVQQDRRLPISQAVIQLAQTLLERIASGESEEGAGGEEESVAAESSRRLLKRAFG